MRRKRVYQQVLGGLKGKYIEGVQKLIIVVEQ